MAVPDPPSDSHDRYDRLNVALAYCGLMIYGGIHPKRASVPEYDSGTLILIGTAPTFWEHLIAAPEGRDGTADPVDRYSLRVLRALARDHHAQEVRFPFGGPPHTPFVAWALASGRAFTSPSQLLVHDEVGMLISYRGAFHFDETFTIPRPKHSKAPCTTCTARPCLSACPVHALVDEGPYKLAACHHHLDTPQGADCMATGCIARRACPLSDGARRQPAQSAHHMRCFHCP